MTTEERLKKQLQPLARQLCKAKGWQLGDFLGAGATAATFEVTTPQGLRALKMLVPPGNIREIIRQIAAAAKFLEDQGICHRDIKSDNIVITDDFSSAILLDLGVVRWLDEDGIGTDHDGQLPFVATAQYSSPEYMFRLCPSGLDLWRGLTFYQLGGLLHDLIMKERLFEDVVQRASENRYLIAYAVATRIPSIVHDGSIPLDLVLLAQRALDKDVTRRLASVEWADFLSSDQARQDEVVLGLRSGETRSQAPVTSVVPKWIRELEDALDRRLIEAGIHCRHDSKVRAHDRAVLELSWTPPVITLPAESQVIVRIEMQEESSKVVLTASSELRIEQEVVASCGPTLLVTLPAILGEPYPPTLVDHSRQGFIALSARVVTSHSRAAAQGTKS